MRNIRIAGIVKNFIGKKINMSVAAGIAVIIILMIIPTGYEDAVIYKEAERVPALIVSTNEDLVRASGMIQYGEQTCEVKILSGKFKGATASAVNMLQGSLDSDKIFAQGDKALVVLSYENDEILSVVLMDHYRLNVEIVLAGVFVLFLIVIAGKTGARAMMAFFITILSIWKILVPCLLRGVSPIGVGFAITALIAAVTISLIFGFDTRCLAAFSGSALGIVATCVMGVIFTDLFKIHGAVMPYSQTLLYSGFEYLNLTEIFKASIFIGASGAMSDLAVGITSAVKEVVDKVPGISWKAAAKSGFNVGRAELGTMTTTLLLAYSGGYIVLLMTFMAQGTPIYNILNYKGVSAEILETIVGSFGLTTVAPFTALTAGFLLTRKKRVEMSENSKQETN